MSELPDNIWIDPRVLKTMSTERDPNYQADQVQYIHADIVREKVSKARNQIIDTIPAEFVVQVQGITHKVGSLQSDSVLALTNLGRLFYEDAPGIWKPYGGPDLGTPALNQPELDENGVPF
jgi:hypothetical protein